jgi:hypothetical protein
VLSWNTQAPVSGLNSEISAAPSCGRFRSPHVRRATSSLRIVPTAVASAIVTLTGAVSLMVNVSLTVAAQMLR